MQSRHISWTSFRQERDGKREEEEEKMKRGVRGKRIKRSEEGRKERGMRERILQKNLASVVSDAVDCRDDLCSSERERSC